MNLIVRLPLAFVTSAGGSWCLGHVLRGGRKPISQRGATDHTMPKLKTHKGAAKRLKMTSTGKIMRMKGLRGHLRRNRAHRATELYDKMLVVSPADKKRLALLIPYGTA